MKQPPKSLKDLKRKNNGSQGGQNSEKNMHSAIGNARGNQFNGLTLGLVTFVTMLFFVSFFYVYSQGMTIKVSPDEATLSGYIKLESGIGWVSGEGQVYALGSNYRISVHAEDFISQTIDITSNTTSSYLEVILVPKPASVSITTTPELNETKWILNNNLVSTGADFQGSLEPGDYRLVINHPYFEPQEHLLSLDRAEGFELNIPLSKTQGQISIQSLPLKGAVSIDGGFPIILPYRGSLNGGKHIIHVQAEGYVPISDEVEVTNTQKIIQREYVLRPLKSKVKITATPITAQITLDGRFINNNTLIAINANQSYRIEISQKGYHTETKTIRLPPGQVQELTLDLKPSTGQMSFISEPRGANLIINGKPLGKAPLLLELQNLPIRVEASLPGHRTSVINTTPITNQLATVNFKLYTELEARLKELPPVMIDSAGVETVRFEPDKNTFYIGAERYEVGQRANEIIRQVQLTKYFYAGKYEITVGQFKKFDPSFVSGQANSMPVTNITWTQAAQFCNWLSQNANLKPFYQINRSQVVGYDKFSDGYRLPSETEWEWLARKANREKLTPFSWGNMRTITTASGNLADESAKGSVPTYVPGYNDNFIGSASVGSFPAELSGLHDMSGNVREWVNDRYSLAIPVKGKIAVNSFGPSFGEGNVVKGSGFRSATLTDLRAARRYQEHSGSEDIGFRVVRFVYGAEDR